MTDPLSTKIRLFILIVNTIDLFGTFSFFRQNLSITHHLLSPTLIFTVYVMIGTFFMCSIMRYRASNFLKLYGLSVCLIMAIYLCVILWQSMVIQTNYRAVIHGLLPILTVILLISDVIVIILSSEITLPRRRLALSEDQSGRANLEKISVRTTKSSPI